MVLCDAAWADPDENSSNGIDVKAQLDFLRLDSMIMMVQINIRQILQVQIPKIYRSFRYLDHSGPPDTDPAGTDRACAEPRPNEGLACYARNVGF